MAEPAKTSSDTISWTPPQLAAIEHVAGDLLVSAAAGSGKTAVLAEKCARLVCDFRAERRTGVENLLVVTFTEAAAAEMRTRIAQAIDRTQREQASRGIPEEQRAWLRRQAAMVDRAAISTLHAFCARTLRQHFHEADVDPAFEVMDEDEARLLRDNVLDQLMAKWHQLPPGGTGPLTRERFLDFFERYAQGRESRCAQIILAVHRMLATTADPGAYVDAARAVYADAEKTLAMYNRETLGDALRVAQLTAERACQEVEATLYADSMIDGLIAARDAIRVARDYVMETGTRAWVPIFEMLRYKWPDLRRIKEIPDFDQFRKRTWDRTKKLLEKVSRPFAHDPAVMVEDLRPLAAPLDTLLAMTAEFQQAFTASKRADNRLDFNDLERFTLQMFQRADQSVTQELRRRYHHVLVDEFQDINPLQAALLHAVRNPASANRGGNLFRVGDVKQSIYGFRLAEPNLFLREEEAARAGANRYVALPHNFRSRPGLIAVMNGLFERMLTPEIAGIAYRDGHVLQSPSAAKRSDDAGSAAEGMPVELHLLAMDAGGAEGADDEPARDASEASGDDESPDKAPPSENLTAVEQEARMVADRIAALLAEGRPIRTKDGKIRMIEPRDIAVLLRAMKSRAMIFARAFAGRGIPFHAELSSGFFDTPEVANTLALLHVLDNPQQDIPLATVLLGPYGGFSHDELALIRLTYDRDEVPFHLATARYAADAVDANPADPLDPGDSIRNAGVLANHPPFAPNLAARLRMLFEKLGRWRERLRTQPLCEGLAEIYAESKILAYAAGLDAGTQRVANLQQLHQRALTFGTFRKQGLHRFLRFLERLQDEEALGGGSGDTGEAAVLSEASNVVRIMSIHKSKGLEFPVVIVACLGTMMNFPRESLLVHRDLGIGLEVVNLDRNVTYPSAASLRIRDALERFLRAEELRLLYVAMTRARDVLILTGHVAKAESLEACRAEWRNHAGPLPEDVLLKARRPLDWLLPAVAAGIAPASPARLQTEERLRVLWPTPEEPVAADSAAQVIVTLHAPKTLADREEVSVADAETIARLLALQPLANVPHDMQADQFLARVQAAYPHADLAARPAVQTVTFLKTQETAPLPDEEVPAPPADLQEVFYAEEAGGGEPGIVAVERERRADAARLRGIATHRLLQLLDFAALPPSGVIPPAALDAQLNAFLKRQLVTQDELDRVDWQGIDWFLHESKAGQRLRAAAHDRALILRREIPFTCLAPPGILPDAGRMPAPQLPADRPTLRGIIDALIATPASRTAELLDYKTDAPFLIPQRLDDYRRQMQYYLQAATDILGYPVTQATLLFLAGRQEVIVPH